jgi:hypothetical protein
MVTPLNGFGRFVMAANVRHELFAEIFDGSENAASDDVAFNFGKPEFHLIKPGGIGGCEVNLHLRMRM